MLRLEQVELAIGGKTLLSGADWRVHPGEKVALVGRNGSGKSTLMRAILGEVHVESGTLAVRRGARLGWLPQEGVPPTDDTVWDTARAWMHELLALEAELRAAEAEVGAPDGPERLERVGERFRMAGGYAMDERVGEVLHGLGFPPSQWRRPCRELSGGWRMRVALGRLLLSEPELLLLDEPTNHLDVTGRSFLAGFLQRYPGTVILVSHDRYLLDRVCSRIAEIRFGRLDTWTGDFGSWQAERARRDIERLSAFESQKEEIARLERFVARVKAKATKAAAARSRQKRIDKIERITAPERQRDARLSLPDPPPSDLEAAALEGADLAWPGGPVVLHGVDLRVERGMRLAVLGPNGAGKSTLLHALDGRLVPLAGRRRIGRQVRVGRYDQELARSLPLEQTPTEWLSLQVPLAGTTKVRSVLGALGLQGEGHERPMSSLSGGEKARVALAAFVLRPASLLLLDEPTNHLDVETVDVLVEALAEFEGALVVVTHDRYLVEEVATHVASVHNGRLEIHPGVRPEDFEPVSLKRESRSVDGAGSDDHAARKLARAERTRLEKQAKKLAKGIEAAEVELARVDEALNQAATGEGPPRFAELGTKRVEIESQIEALFEEWAEVEAALSEPIDPSAD